MDMDFVRLNERGKAFAPVMFPNVLSCKAYSVVGIMMNGDVAIFNENGKIEHIPGRYWEFATE